ncbi:MAG TPA: hypothetical protein VJA94_13830 [Candidatus Angelobacter sp.]
MSRRVIIAALARELQQFVHARPRASLSHDGRTYRVYLGQNVSVVSGIGYKAAYLAARAAVAQYGPEVLVSAGLAGALVPGLKPGTVITPTGIVDAASAKEYLNDGSDGVLVSASEIAGSESKRKLGEKFHAVAVDMEAAAVAEVAQEAGIGFCCVKAISDEVDFVMPPLHQFVDQTGDFHAGKFVTWVAFRPRYWGPTVLLARNSKRASAALCDWLKRHLGDDFDTPSIKLKSEAGSTASKL